MARSFPSEKREALAVALSIAALFIITLHWVHPGRVIGQIDFFPNIAPFTLLSKSLWAWGSFLDANGSFQSPAFVPLYLFTGILNAIFGPSFGQGAYAAFILSLAWLGTWRLARSYGLSLTGSVLAAWAYVLNPYDAYFTLTFITATVFAALLPWLLLFVRRASLADELAWGETARCAALAAVVFPVIAGTPQLMAELVVAVIVWAIYCAAISPARATFRKWLLVSCSVCAVCSLWWFIPIAFTFLLNHVVHPIAASQNVWVYARASLLNVMRLNPGWTWAYPEYFPYASSIDSNVVLYASQFSMFAAAVAGLIAAKGERIRDVRLWVAVLLVAMFVTKGLHEPLAGVNAKIIATPPFFLLLEPAGAMLFGILLASLACASAIDSVRQVSKTRIGGFILPALLALGVILGSYPTIIGTQFHESTPASMSMYVRIPQDWYNLGGYLRRRDERAAVLIAPTNATYQQKYVWGYSGIDLIPHMLLPNPVLMLGAPISYVQDVRSASLNMLIRRALISGSPIAARLLRDMGVGYVVYRHDVLGNNEPTIAEVRRALKGAHVKRFGALELFDIGESEHFWTSETYVATTGTPTDPAPIAAIRARYEPLPRIAAASARGILPAPILLERQLDETHKFSNAIPDRVVFTAESTGRTSSVRLSNHAVTAGVFLRASESGQAFALPTSKLGRASDIQDAKAYPLMTSISLQPKSWTVQVMNPSFQTLRADVIISIQTNRGARFVLAGPVASYSSTAPSGRAIQLLHFESVILPPGYSELTLTHSPAVTARTAPVPAPIQRAGLIYFRHVIALGPRPATLLANAGQNITLSAPAHDHVFAANIPLGGTTVADAPRIQLSVGDYTLGYNPGIVIDYVSRGVSSLCYIPVFINTPIDVADGLNRCGQQDGSFIDDKTVVKRATLDIALPPGWARATGSTAVLGILGWSATSGAYEKVSLLKADPGAVLEVTASAPSALTASASISYSDASGATHVEQVPLVSSEAGRFLLRGSLKALLPRAVRLRSIHVSVDAPPHSSVSDSVSVMVPAPRLSVRFAGRQMKIIAASPELVAGMYGRAPVPEREQPLPGFFSPFYSAIVHVPGGNARILYADQYYSPLWMALLKTPSGANIPRHILVDGWKNGWIVSGPGEVLIFNWANVIQAMLMSVSLLAMFLVWRHAICDERSA